MVVWKDATGTLVPVASWSLADTGTGYLPLFSTFRFADNQGYLWSYAYESDTISTAVGAPWALYTMASCAGPVYVSFIPARATFVLSGTSGPYYVLPDNATATMTTVLTAKTGNQCSNVGPVQLRVTALTNAVTVTPPASFPWKLPIHTELTP